MSLTRCAFSRLLCLQFVLLSGVCTTSAFAASDGSASKTPKSETSKNSQARVPLVFEENAGQLPASTLFAGRAQAYSVQVKSTSLSFAMTGKQRTRMIDVEFSGAKPGQSSGMTQAAFNTNYYVGNDPQKWRTGIRNFDRIALRGLYAGIDAEFYSHNGEIEHDFLLAPHADASRLSMRLSGARAVRLSANGDLMLDAEDGYLRLHKPVAYQVLANGSRKPVESSFCLTEGKKDVSTLSFTLGEYDHERQLVIDPVITYATYVAGSAGSTPAGIVSDTSGNVYLTGTTASPVASFGAATTNGSGDPAGGQTTAFVAELAASAGGSQIAWLSYYGSATGSASATSISMNQGSPTLFVGGSSTALDLPTSAGAFNIAPTANGSTYGFVASFATANGQFSAGTYIEGTSTAAGTTSVMALDTSLAGQVSIAGGTTGKDLSTTATALAVPTAVIQNTSLSKGYVLTLDSALILQAYGTYVAGDIAATGADTQLTGVVTDGLGNLDVTGTTVGDFPKAFGAGAYAANGVYVPAGGKVGTNSFAAQINPTSQDVNYSYWTSGSQNDALNGLKLDASGNLYIYGNTASTDLISNGSITSTYTPSATPPTLTALNNAYPTGATSAGFFAKIDSLGELVVVSYLASQTPGSTTTVTGAAIDAAGNLYFSGRTDGMKAAFPSQTGGIPVTAPLLPGSPVPQDVTQDSPAPPFIGRGYLLALAPSVTTVNGLAYFGPSQGTSSAVGVAIDAAASPNAYVLMKDLPSAGGADFVTASAAQSAPQVTDSATSSAYVAQIAFGVSIPGSIVAGTNSYTPSPAIYEPAPLNFTTETFTWQVMATVSGVTSVVFNLPYSQYLKPYTLSMLTLNGTPVTASQCTLGTSSSANTLPGITCVLPSLAESATDTFVLKDDVTPAVATAALALTASVPISAAAFDAQGVSIDLTQNMSIIAVPNLTLTNTVNAAQTATVNAAVSATDSTTPNTNVSYVYTIKNTSSVDSPFTKLTTNLGTSTSTFTQTSAVSSTGCDPTTAATGCDVPGGSTLTYTVQGVYLASQFAGQPGTSAYTSTTSAPTLSYTPTFPTAPTVTGTQVTVSIYGNATLSVAVTSSTPTYAGGFQLGDKNVSVVAAISNTGIDVAGSATVTLTLPHGFVAVSSSATSGTGSANCSAAPYTTCTFSNIAVGTGTANLTVVGSFSDTGTTSDAVAPPVTSAAPTPATVAASPTSGSVNTSVPVGGLTVPSNGTYVTLPTTPSSLNLLVTRVNNLNVTLSNVGSTVNETSTIDPNSGMTTYNATVVNSGVSVARGLYFTIPVPVSATGTTATVSNLAATSVPAVNVANQLSCSSSSSTITCYENDLTAVSTGSSTAGVAYAVSFSASFPETTIPLTTVSGKTTATQTAATFYAAADKYTTATTTAPNATTLTIQRSTAVHQIYTVTPVVNAPGTYADQTDINLDEHIAGNGPGVNDTVTVTASTWNAGANDAAGINVSLPLPAYFMLLKALPSTCTIGGVGVPAMYVTSASGAVVTCIPTSITTPAGTAAGQLTAGGSPCTVLGPGCLYLTVTGKFIDAPSANTIVGMLPKVTVAPASGVAIGNNADAGTYLTSAVPSPFGVQRAAHLAEAFLPTPQVHAPATYLDKTDINLDEHIAGNVGGVNDQLFITSATYNSGVNYALNVSLVVPLPGYLQIFSALPAGCVFTASGASSVPYTTPAGGDSITCIPPVPSGVLPYGSSCSTTNNAQCIYISLAAKFVDTPNALTIVGNNAKVSVALPAATVAGVYSDANTTQTPITPAVFGVQRAAHLAETLAITPQVHAPATFADKTDINLDEHIAGNAGGVNDQLIVTSTTFNSGVNYALNVSVVVQIPGYLEIFSLPTGCVFTASPATVPTASLPYTTPAGGDSLTCIPPSSSLVTPNTPSGVLLYNGSCATTTNAQCIYANFLAKFVDSTTSSATIVGNSGKATITPSAATVSGTYSDANTTQTPNTPAPFGVQRAAHLRLGAVNPILPTYTDNSVLTLDGTTPEIGQAAAGANVSTHTTNGSLIYNCIRYTVALVNEGPNYTNTPVFNYAITQTPFTTARATVGAAATSGANATLGPINCSVGAAYGNTVAASAPQSLPVGSIAYNNGTQTLELDGYFGLTALGGANSAISSFQTSAFTSLDYQDSDTVGTITNKDYQASKQVEVVNTPINNAAVGGFTITPVGTSPSPAVNLYFTSVTSPGTTSASVSTAALSASSTGAGPGVVPILPAGKSPYPPDAGAIKKLYQSGKSTFLYSVPSTAIAPSPASPGGTNANPTGVCITPQSSSLPDLFVKPERTLLWALQNVPANTLYNPMGPSSGATIVITPTSAAPATGDITMSVSTMGAAYLAVPTSLTFPQPPQAQPYQLCGQVNGFTTSTVAPVTFAVLEPVNFAPYVVANTATVSAQTGKGSTSSQTDIYLQVSSSQTHDFNDKDPCYIGGTRSFCDDNPYLDVFLFGGGNLGTSALNAAGSPVPLASPIPLSTLNTELNCGVASPCPNGKNLLQANFTTGEQAYVAIADQATGADALDSLIVSSVPGNYAANPYTNQGNFLKANPAGGVTVCDPGTATGYYTPVPALACSTVVLAATTAVPSELYIPAGSGTNFTLGNVGAQLVTGSVGSSSGLIPLPYPITSPTVQVPQNPTVSSTSTTPLPATASVTPGQTAGFIWNWLNGSVQQSSSAYYTLACTSVASLTSVTPTTLPAGTTCSISTSNPNAPTPQTFSSSPANYAPTIYVTTTGNQFAKVESPRWKYLGGGISLALMLPLFALRRRFRRGMMLAVVLLALAVAPMLTGCGSSSSISANSANVTPAGTYYFQVTATAQSPATSPAAVYSAVFKVVVQPAN